MNFVLAAIFVCLSYGIADNIHAYLLKRTSALKLGFWVSVFEFLIGIPLLIFIFSDEIHKLSLSNLAWLTGTALLVAVGWLAFLMGLKKGSIILTGTISGAYPVVSIFIGLVFFNETINGGQMLAIALTLIGVILSSAGGQLSKMLKNIQGSVLLYAFTAFILFGVSLAVVKVPVENVGWLMPLLFIDLVCAIVYYLFAKSVKEPNFLSLPKSSGLVFISAAILVASSLMYYYAITKGPIAIVVPITGSGVAVFVLLAHYFFKEKLTSLQKSGIALTLIGVISLSFLSA